jgi:hypothetical protein
MASPEEPAAQKSEDEETPPPKTITKINPSRFYFQWAGHPINDLATLHKNHLATSPSTPIIYLAGDSSLDNKYWVPSASSDSDPLPVPPPAYYTTNFTRPTPKPDIAFWLNHFLSDTATTLNCAVEESMLRDRAAALLPHDKFIRDHIREQDILVVSVGANDVALKPTLGTIANMLALSWLTPFSSLQRGNALALGHFVSMFGAETKRYIERIIAKTKPRAVVVCMIYFPLEADAGSQSSWADLPLKALGYNSNPKRLQAAIKAMYARATETLEVEGTTVVPCALYEVLDGKTEEDYTARVEPSVEGGRKMGERFAEIIQGLL